MEKKDFIITENDAQRRIDIVIRTFLSHIPLSGIYKALRTKKILVNGKKVIQTYKLKYGDVLSIDTYLLSYEKKDEKADISYPKSYSLEIILKTKDLICINKPVGIVVHGENSLDTIVKKDYTNEVAPSLSFTPGSLHRLDKNTSGVIFFSLSLRGAQWFSENLSQHAFKKFYLGIIEGTLSHRQSKSPVRWTSNENEMPALTEVSHIAYNAEQDISLVLFNLITGRKHQIRRHCSKNGIPLLGDSHYGSKRKPLPQSKNYFLHSWIFSFPPTRLADLPSFIEAPLPSAFEKYLEFFAANSKERAYRLVKEFINVLA